MSAASCALWLTCCVVLTCSLTSAEIRNMYCRVFERLSRFNNLPLLSYNPDKPQLANITDMVQNEINSTMSRLADDFNITEDSLYALELTLHKLQELKYALPTEQEIDEMNRQQLVDKIDNYNRQKDYLSLIPPIKCYKHLEPAKTWITAKNLCINGYGMMLANIKDQDEQDFIVNSINGTTAVWLGAKRVGSRFLWRPSYERLTYKYPSWGPLNVNGRSKRYNNCLVLRTDGKWEGKMCSYRRPVLCEDDI